MLVSMADTTRTVGTAAHLRLLGVPRYENGQSLPVRLGHKQLVLLTRLLLEKRQMTRESMIAFLWPESDEVRARGSLRQALYVIRELLGEDSLVANRHTIAVRVSTPTDLTRFIHAAHAGQWWDAARLYRGPLLDGVHIKDATDADLWLELERRRMARLFETAAVAALRGPRGPYDPRECVPIARQLRDTAPRCVTYWQYLIDALADAGAPDDCRIEYAALSARIDTGQIDDAKSAAELLNVGQKALSSLLDSSRSNQARFVGRH